MKQTNSKATPRRRLGRGLDSLISTPVKIDLNPPAKPPDPIDSGEVNSGSPPAAPASTASRGGESPSGPGLRMIPLGSIRPNPAQPRQHFDEAGLEALAQSIRAAGLMQPLIVRPARDETGTPSRAEDAGDAVDARDVGGVGGFELIAGERRWRAAQRLGLESIPAIVHEVDDRTSAQWALIENLQREDLNPIERALAFQRMIEEFGLTHQEIAERVQLDRSTITNHVRLLELDDTIRAALSKGDLSMGHARALLAITNVSRRARLAIEAMRHGLSVRQVERAARTFMDDAAKRDGADGAGTAEGSGGVGAEVMSPARAHLLDLERKLAAHLGTKVQIQRSRNRKSGSLIIDFYSLDQFEGLLKRLGFEMD